ncbi:MAG TPA: TonB family protein [Pyrinomonadaceae bacterium]
MSQDAPFWRNVTIISIAHFAIILALFRWNVDARRPDLQTIVWMSGAIAETVAKPESSRKDSSAEKTSLPKSPQTNPEENLEQRPTPAPSDLQLPAPTPSPAAASTPIPKPTAAASASPRVTPKTTPKPTRKKVVTATPAPKATAKKKMSPIEEKKENDSAKVAPSNASDADGSNSASTASDGSAGASEYRWYGKMLHDRFYSEWVQPKTSTAVGTKISALVRIRIEKDGRISSFAIVKPSGNIVVDESVAAVGERVKQVDPLPTGLGSGAHYEVTINFELSPEM